MIINNYAYWIKNQEKKENHYFFACDINYDACYLTKKFSDYYKVFLNIIRKFESFNRTRLKL